MTGEGHSRPETEPVGGLVDLLTRWEARGGHWHVVDEAEEWLTVALLHRGGERTSRVRGPRTAGLTAFLRGRTASRA